MASTRLSWRHLSVTSTASVVLLPSTGTAEGWALGLALGLALFSAVVDQGQRCARPGEHL